MKVEDQLRNATFTESQIDHYVHSINSRAFCMSSHNQSRISSQRSSIIQKPNRYSHYNYSSEKAGSSSYPHRQRLLSYTPKSSEQYKRNKLKILQQTYQFGEHSLKSNEQMVQNDDTTIQSNRESTMPAKHGWTSHRSVK